MIPSKMNATCCSLHFTLASCVLSYPGFFCSAGIAEDNGGREGVARPGQTWLTRFLQLLELPICLQGLQSGLKCAPDINA